MKKGEWMVTAEVQAKRDRKRWEMLNREARDLIKKGVTPSERALRELKDSAPSKRHKRPANWNTLIRKGVGNMKEAKSGKNN